MSTPTRALRSAVLPLTLVLCVPVSGARAEVERIEVTSRSTFAGGQAFGEVGAYEKIRGRPVDVEKLVPLAVGVIMFFVSIFLLGLWFDLFGPGLDFG